MLILLIRGREMLINYENNILVMAKLKGHAGMVQQLLRAATLVCAPQQSSWHSLSAGPAICVLYPLLSDQFNGGMVTEVCR